MKQDVLVKFSIAIRESTKKKIDKKAAMQNKSRSQAINDTIANHEKLQELFHAASKVLNCIPGDSSNFYFEGFYEALDEYKKKRDKYFSLK
jgi:hypothetical protein